MKELTRCDLDKLDPESVYFVHIEIYNRTGMTKVKSYLASGAQIIEQIKEEFGWADCRAERTTLKEFMKDTQQLMDGGGWDFITVFTLL